RFGDSPALEERCDTRPARTRGVADGSRGEHGALEGLFAIDLGSRCPGTHCDGYAGVHPIHRAVGKEVARSEQLVDRMASEHHRVEPLASAHALFGVDATDGLQRY